jgi:hypothetical protein
MNSASCSRHVKDMHSRLLLTELGSSGSATFAIRNCIVRQAIERVTCDVCGLVLDFESLSIAPLGIVARIEPLLTVLETAGWQIQPIIGTRWRTIDKCPACSELGPVRHRRKAKKQVEDTAAAITSPP